MAQKIVLVDDLNGEKADLTVEFALDGTVYAIDLTKENAATLRETFQEYTNAARVKRRPKPPSKRNGVKASEIREWAQRQGRDVPATGRVPASLRQEYEDAMAS